jgi:hypothetical protein
MSVKLWSTLAESRQAGFWRFAADPYPRCGFTDGTEWILEGRVGEEYHRITQHIPRDTPFRALCVKMLETSGLKLNEFEWEEFYGNGVEPAE